MIIKILSAAAVMLFSAGANAIDYDSPCPDISGKWAASFDATVGGEMYVGVYALNIMETTINSAGYEGAIGLRDFAKTSGPYTVNSSCKITYQPDVGFRWDGYIVNEDKILLIGTSEMLGISLKGIAERREFVAVF